jgi:large subunit ribosomal protein L13
MKTQSAKPAELERKWFVIDAEDAVLGRLASKVAHMLRGKHKPVFTPNLDTGDFIVVVNADKVKVTGKKEEEKIYWRYTGFYGHEKSTKLGRQRSEHPDRMITIAVRGMLPKGPLGRQMLRKLRVYGGAAHPHTAQQPEKISV